MFAVALAGRPKDGGEQGLGVLDFRILPGMLWVNGEWLARERVLVGRICGCCSCCNGGCAICCVMATRPPVCTMEQPAEVLQVAGVRGVSVRSCESDDGREIAHAPPSSAKGSLGEQFSSAAAAMLRVLVKVA